MAIRARAELDSHADTCCDKAAFHVIEYSGQTCDVIPFSQEYEPMKEYLLLKLALDDPETAKLLS